MEPEMKLPYIKHEPTWKAMRKYTYFSIGLGGAVAVVTRLLIHMASKEVVQDANALWQAHYVTDLKSHLSK